MKIAQFPYFLYDLDKLGTKILYKPYIFRKTYNNWFLAYFQVSSGIQNDQNTPNSGEKSNTGGGGPLKINPIIFFAI